MAKVIFSYLNSNRKEDYEIIKNYQNCKFVSTSHYEYNLNDGFRTKSDIFRIPGISPFYKEKFQYKDSKNISLCLDINYTSNNLKNNHDSTTKQIIQNYNPKFYSTSTTIDKKLKSNTIKLVGFLKSPSHQYLIQNLTESFIKKLESK